MKGFGKSINSKNIYKRNKVIQDKCQVLFEKALNYHHKGDILSAIKSYKYLIDSGFNHPDVFGNYGILLRDRGELEKAEVYLRKSVDLKPSSEIHNFNLGAILRDIGNLKEAEKFSKKAIDLKEDFAEAYYNLGVIFSLQEKIEEAENSLKKAIELKKNFHMAIAELGKILLRKGKHKEGIKAIRDACGSIVFDYDLNKLVIYS